MFGVYGMNACIRLNFRPVRQNDKVSEVVPPCRLQGTDPLVVALSVKLVNPVSFENH